MQYVTYVYRVLVDREKYDPDLDHISDRFMRQYVFLKYHEMKSHLKK